MRPFYFQANLQERSTRLKTELGVLERWGGWLRVLVLAEDWGEV